MGNHILYLRGVSEDDKSVSHANFAGLADDPAYTLTFYNHEHWRQWDRQQAECRSDLLWYDVCFQGDLDLQGWVLWVRPPFCLDDRAVNTGSGPVNLLCIVHILQNDMVKFLPNTGFLPIPKSAPAGHTTAASQLLWQVFPWYSCVWRTKIILVKAARSDRRGWPPLGVGLYSGKRGLTTLHNSSLTSFLGISFTHTSILHPIPLFVRFC